MPTPLQPPPIPRLLLLLALLAVASGSVPASAAIYKWVDPEGGVHYTDTRPEPSQVRKGTRVEEFIRDAPRSRPAAPPAGETPLTAPPEPAPSGTPGAVIFTVPNDRPSRQVRQWMTEQGVPFLEFDVKNQKGARARMEALGNAGGQVPFVVMNGWSILGFDPERLARALSSPPD